MQSYGFSNIGLSDALPVVGQSVEKIGYVSSSENIYSFSFISNDYSYAYCNISWLPESFAVDRVPVRLNIAISDLVDSITVFDLWSVFNNAIPYILVVVLVSFGIYLISHAIREISKGRDI